MYKSMSTVEDALTLSNLGTFLKVGGRLRVPDSTGDFGVAPSASAYDALWKQPLDVNVCFIAVLALIQ